MRKSGTPTGVTLPIPRAALLILQEEPGGAALHYQTITARLLTRELIVSASQAVPRSVYSSLSKHIRELGVRSLFLHAGPGLYGLTELGKRAEVWKYGSGPEAHSSQSIADVRTDLSWLDAAEAVLTEAGEDLHPKVIVDRIWAKGLKARKDTRCPYRQMGNELAKAIRDAANGSGRRTFVRGPAGTYGRAPNSESIGGTSGFKAPTQNTHEDFEDLSSDYD